MDSPDLTSAAFWEEPRPSVFAGPRLQGQARSLEELLAEEDWAQNGVVFASSGSTGEPKWVLFHKEALLASAAMVNHHLEVQAEDHWLLALPKWHVGGFGVVARVVEAGCRFSEFAGRWDPQRFAKQIDENGATCTSLVPTQVHDLVTEAVVAPGSLRAVVVGGGRLENEAGREARRLGWPVLQSYGMTEAGSQVATASLECLDEDFSAESLPVLSGWEVALADGGCLRVRGDALFEGYVVVNGEVPRLDKVAEDGWFSTSDLVTLSDGRLTWTGRADRTVKILGELVDVDGLERALFDFAGAVNMAHLVDVPDARKGVRLVPIVEGKAEWAGIVDRFNARQAGYARLDPPVAVASIPRTALGKPDLLALRELAQGSDRG